MVWHRRETTQTEVHFIHAAFTTLPAEQITDTSLENWCPTGRVASHLVEAKSYRIRRLKCYTLPGADGRPILRRTHIRIRTRQCPFSLCHRLRHIHRAGLTRPM